MLMEKQSSTNVITQFSLASSYQTSAQRATRRPGEREEYSSQELLDPRILFRELHSEKGRLSTRV